MPNVSAKAEPAGIESLKALKSSLAVRAKIASSLRRAFEAAAFIETETPVGIFAPAAEEYIEAPKAASFFLRTSPELQMKRLLAAGMERIYQLGPCFRAGENGRRHRPEFTMLEYYMTGADYLELLDFTLPPSAPTFTVRTVSDSEKTRSTSTSWRSFRCARHSADLQMKTPTGVRRKTPVSSSFSWTESSLPCRKTVPAS